MESQESLSPKGNFTLVAQVITPTARLAWTLSCYFSVEYVLNLDLFQPKPKKSVLLVAKLLKQNVTEPLNCNVTSAVEVYIGNVLASKLKANAWQFLAGPAYSLLTWLHSFLEDPTEILPSTPSESDVKASELNVVKRHANNLKLGHLNVNSISGFKFFDDKNMLANNLLDILLLSETKIVDSYPDSQFHVKGFKVYRQDTINARISAQLQISAPLRINAPLKAQNSSVISAPLQISAPPPSPPSKNEIRY